MALCYKHLFKKQPTLKKSQEAGTEYSVNMFAVVYANAILKC